MSVALPSTTTVGTATRTRIAFQWRPLLRPAAALLIVVAAYRVSLVNLFEFLRLDTPLAHLALVPFIALGLAAVSRRNDAGPDIHDRQLDWIVGLGLTVAALAGNVILPARLSTQFWEWRVDLLTLPLFVAGVVTLLFGVRTLWKYRLAVLFLFLGWPYPYTVMLDRWLGKFTAMTIWGLNEALNHWHLATEVIGSDSVFQVLHKSGSIQMSVASACSGANGIVGFSLVASAFLLVVNGSKKRKIAWLLTGSALVWLLNIVRILVIFWAAGKWGERVAIDGFHPYMGLVVFNIAVIIMVFLLRPFGLRMPRRTPKRPAPTDPAAGPPAMPAPYRPKLPAAMACVSILALGVGVFNGQLNQYDRIADSLGSPRLAAFAQSRETPTGWALNEVSTQKGYERFFGSDSTWIRYSYGFQGDTSSPLQANVPITADVIDTSDRAALNAYGVDQCYTFHGYSITGRQSVDLGEGLVGGMLTWTDQKTNLTWTTLYWHWPIKTPSGTRYERVTLIMNDQPSNVFVSPKISTGGTRQLQLDIDDVLRGNGSDADKARLLETRQFLIGFAQQLVKLRAPAA